MRSQVGKREFRARLALAQKFARAAQLEIAFGDDEPVIRLMTPRRAVAVSESGDWYSRQDEAVSLLPTRPRELAAVPARNVRHAR